MRRNPRPAAAAPPGAGGHPVAVCCVPCSQCGHHWAPLWTEVAEVAFHPGLGDAGNIPQPSLLAAY